MLGSCIAENTSVNNYCYNCNSRQLLVSVGFFLNINTQKRKIIQSSKWIHPTLHSCYKVICHQVIHYHCHHGNIAILMSDYLTLRCRENKLSSYPYIKAHTYTLVC